MGVNIYNAIQKHSHRLPYKQYNFKNKRMLLDIEQKDQEIIVSYYDKEGKVAFKRYPISQFENWVVTEEKDKWKDGTFRNWDGRPIKRQRARNFNKFSLVYFMDSLPEKDQEEILVKDLEKNQREDLEERSRERSG